MSYTTKDEPVSALRTAAVLAIALPISMWVGLALAIAIKVATAETTMREGASTATILACLVIPFMAISRVLFLFDARRATGDGPFGQDAATCASSGERG